MAYYRVKVTRDALGRPVEWRSDPQHPNLIFMPRRVGQKGAKPKRPKKKRVAKVLPFKSGPEIG